jgi:hypothetical protein
MAVSLSLVDKFGELAWSPTARQGDIRNEWLKREATGRFQRSQLHFETHVVWRAQWAGG